MNRTAMAAVLLLTVGFGHAEAESAEGTLFEDPVTGLELESPISVGCTDIGSGQVSWGLSGFDACAAAEAADVVCKDFGNGTCTTFQCTTGSFAYEKFKTIWIYYNSNTDGHMKAQGFHTTQAGDTHQNYYWYTWWRDGVKIAGNSQSYPYNHIVCDEKEYFQATWYSKKIHGTEVIAQLLGDTSIPDCQTDAPNGRFGAGATFS